MTKTKPQDPPIALYTKTLPIFNKDESIYAYELSIDERNFAKGNYETEESRKKFAESFSKLDLDKLVSQTPTVCHFHNNFLTGDAVGYLQQKVNIKIDNAFPINDDNIKICRGFKRDGCSIFLDDIFMYKELTPLTTLASVVFFDWKDYFDSESNSLKNKELETLLEQVKAAQCKLLATNIDTFNDYIRASRFDIDYFQGDFYLEQIPTSWRKLRRISLLAELWNPTNNLEDINRILQPEAFMVNKMFLFVNSPAFDLVQKVNSLQHMLSLLGKKEVVRMVTLISLAEMSADRPNKIFSTAMMRGRFAEIIAKSLGQKDKSDLFFAAATFTLLDAFLDMPKDKVFNKLAISNTLQEMMRLEFVTEISELVTAYENGDWMAVDLLRLKLKLDKNILLQAYEDANNWTQIVEEFFREQAPPVNATTNVILKK